MNVYRLGKINAATRESIRNRFPHHSLSDSTKVYLVDREQFIYTHHAPAIVVCMRDLLIVARGRESRAADGDMVLIPRDSHAYQKMFMRRAAMALGLLIPLTIGCWIACPKTPSAERAYQRICTVLDSTDVVNNRALRIDIATIIESGMHDASLMDLFGRIINSRRYDLQTRRCAAVAAYEQALHFGDMEKAEYYQNTFFTDLR